MPENRPTPEEGMHPTSEPRQFTEVEIDPRYTRPLPTPEAQGQVERCPKRCGYGRDLPTDAFGVRIGCDDAFHDTAPCEAMKLRSGEIVYGSIAAMLELSSALGQTVIDHSPTEAQPTDVGLTPADPTEQTSELDLEAQPVEQGERALWEAQRRCGECGTLVEVPAQPCHDAIHLQSQIEELRGELDNERFYTAQYKGGAQAYRKQAEAAESALTTAQSQIEELTENVRNWEAKFNHTWERAAEAETRVEELTRERDRIEQLGREKMIERDKARATLHDLLNALRGYRTRVVDPGLDLACDKALALLDRRG